MKPRALDLFCGAGGATKGLQRAGFHVTGIDIKRQPRYCGDAFIQGDATNKPVDLKAFDFIWASPPCQRHSRMSGCRAGLSDSYPDLIGHIREILQASGAPFVIENVPGAPLRNPITLCGAMFYRDTYRHRIFEWSGFDLWWPPHVQHTVPASKAGHWKPGTFVSVAGHCSPIDKCREVMGIDWMNREELAEAIPPDYSEFIAEQLAHPIWGSLAQGGRQDAAAGKSGVGL